MSPQPRPDVGPPEDDPGRPVLDLLGLCLALALAVPVLVWAALTAPGPERPDR